MRKASAAFLITTVVAAVISGWYFYVSSDKPSVSFDDVDVEVELAQTTQERVQGLSGREKLASGQGMLFIFDEPDIYAFHMKDMNFAIDIIWMDEDRRVVDITHSLSPDTFPERFRPSSPAQYVLEVPAGFSQDNGIKVGDKAQLNYSP